MDNSIGSRLNHDILVMVAHLLARSPHNIGVVSAMCQTCRHLYFECAPLLLSPRPIKLHGDIRIESFCRYMLSDIDRRAHRLSQLPLLQFGPGRDRDPLSKSTTELLVEVLGHITMVPWLGFRLFERFMSSSPRVLKAFAAFRAARCLEISVDQFPGKWSYAKFLKAMEAPLECARLALRDYDSKKNMTFVTYSRNLDPIWLFSAISPTLESIDLDGRFTAEACSMIHIYPRLSHFTIHHCSMPLVRPYITAYPSLRVLQFDPDPYLWATRFMPKEDVQEATLRNKKAEDLRRHNREDQLAHGSWPELEYFMGLTLDAYVAGLTCRVHTLHLVAWGGSTEGEVSAICAIFADTRPSTFRLALRPQHVDYIPSLFSHQLEVFSSLTSLELRLDLTEAPFDFGSYFDDVGAALQWLSIISLQVEIKCWTQFTPWKINQPRRKYCDELYERREPGHTLHCYILEALAKEDINGRLQYFLQQIHTLRRVTIAWGHCFTDIPYRFITVDLDNIPHTVDRRGQMADNYWQEGYPLNKWKH